MAVVFPLLPYGWQISGNRQYWGSGGLLNKCHLFPLSGMNRGSLLKIKGRLLKQSGYFSVDMYKINSQSGVVTEPKL